MPQLKIDQLINDSTIVLRWSKFTGNNFKKYRLLRNATYFKNGQFGSFVEPVDSSSDVNHLTFTENKMPLASEIYYDLQVMIDPTQFYQTVGYVYYQRPNSLFYGLPTDVLIDEEQKKLYVTEQQKIGVVDYTTGRQVSSKNFPVTIGFCNLGNFNGSRELYVPLNDGWLEILDAVTLQQRDRIYVAGYGIGSVVAVNEKVYVSSSEDTGWVFTLRQSL
jgi:hypothetical protein